MRGLTTAEARVIQTLIEGGASTEVELIERSGVPRSTFQYVRRRAYGRGWLYDRYLPSPQLTRASSVTVVLARPFAERRSRALRAWTSDPRVVVLWSSANVSLVVTVDTEAGRRTAFPPIPEAAGQGSRGVSLTAPAAGDMIPVFFDASGALSRLFGLRKPQTFPIGFARDGEEAPGRDEAPLSDRRSRYVREFLAATEAEGGGLLRRSVPPIPWTLPRSEAALVEKGLLRWRVFPRLDRIPPFQGRGAQDIVFVHGTMTDGCDGREFLRALAGECGVLPFLLMVGGSAPAKALVGFLALGGRGAGPGRLAQRSSVQAFLQARLKRMTIVREPLGAMANLVNHRYHDLLSGGAGG